MMISIVVDLLSSVPQKSANRLTRIIEGSKRPATAPRRELLYFAAKWRCSIRGPRYAFLQLT